MREWLIQLRKFKQLTQEQVASSSFIHRSYYSQIEGGKRSPSFNVAKNIAKVLEFNPLQFYKEDERNTSFEPANSFLNMDIFQLDILEYFRNLDQGKILYSYCDLRDYNKYLFEYLLVIVQNNRHCILIEDQEIYSDLKNKLKFISSSENIIKYISHFNVNECGCEENLLNLKEDLLRHSKANNNTSIWLHEQNPVRIWDKLLELNLDLANIPVVQAFNASLISAGEYIKMMKRHPLIMIDGQIIKSPFYNKNKDSLVLPSFRIQEDI